MKIIFIVLIALAGTLVIIGPGFSAHKEEADTIKGAVMKIEPSEYEVTIKEETGKETKVKLKDLAGIKTGDSVVIKKGKVAPAVKPKTGGY